MTVVEYMLAIIAIVLGLAIGKVLDKFSTTIKGNGWTEFNWFLSGWSLYILASILGYFWGFWRLYSGVDEIPYFEFLLMPFTTVTLIYLIAVFLPISTEIKMFKRRLNILCQKRSLSSSYSLFWLSI